TDPDAHKGLRMTLHLFLAIPDHDFFPVILAKARISERSSAPLAEPNDSSHDIPDHAFLPVIKTEVQKTPKD
ncbi:MAG: hypothetical protein IJ870_05755, partial [Alphaproteobacteria bacterium]|nr:hypothetical protein [Alphaproteobacteria bacterium]